MGGGDCHCSKPAARVRGREAAFDRAHRARGGYSRRGLRALQDRRGGRRRDSSRMDHGERQRGRWKEESKECRGGRATFRSSRVGRSAEAKSALGQALSRCPICGGAPPSQSLTGQSTLTYSKPVRSRRSSRLEHRLCHCGCVSSCRPQPPAPRKTKLTRPWPPSQWRALPIETRPRSCWLIAFPWPPLALFPSPRHAAAIDAGISV